MSEEQTTEVIADSGLVDKIVDALKQTGAVKVLEDSFLPGCSHFPSRMTVRFQVANDPAWRTYRLRMLQALAETVPQPKMHLCQQFIYTDKYTGKKQLLQVNTLEVEGGEQTVDAVVKLILGSRKGPIDARLAETTINVGGNEGRVENIKSERFTPNMTMGGKRIR